MAVRSRTLRGPTSGQRFRSRTPIGMGRGLWACGRLGAPQPRRSTSRPTDEPNARMTDPPTSPPASWPRTLATGKRRRDRFRTICGQPPHPQTRTPSHRPSFPPHPAPVPPPPARRPPPATEQTPRLRSGQRVVADTPPQRQSRGTGRDGTGRDGTGRGGVRGGLGVGGRTAWVRVVGSVVGPTHATLARWNVDA